MNTVSAILCAAKIGNGVAILATWLIIVVGFLWLGAAILMKRWLSLLRRHPFVALFTFSVLFLTTALLIPALLCRDNAKYGVKSEPTSITALPKIAVQTFDPQYCFRPAVIPLQVREGGVLMGLGTIHKMDSSQDGNVIVVANGMGILVWNRKENPAAPVLWSPVLNDAILCLDLSPDDRYLAIGTQKGNVYVWETQTWKPVVAFQTNLNFVSNVVFSPNSKTIAAVCANSVVALLDFHQGVVLQAMRMEIHYTISSLQFSPDGRELLILENNWPDCCLFDWEKLRLERTFHGHKTNNKTAMFSHDGQKILFGGDNFTLREKPIRQEAQGNAPPIYSGCRSEISCLALSPGGERAAAGCLDGSVVLWDRATQKVIASIDAPSGSVISGPEPNEYPCAALHLRFLLDGDRILIGRKNGSIEIYNLSTNKTSVRFSGHTSAVSSGCEFADWTKILIGCADGGARLQDLRDGRILRFFSGIGARVTNLKLSPDDTKFACLDANGIVSLRDIETGDVLFERGAETGGLGRNDWFGEIAFSPDGKRLAAGDTYVETRADGKDFMETKWFDVQSGQLEQTWESIHSGFPSPQIGRDNRRDSACLLFLRDRKKVLAGNRRSPILWNFESGKAMLNIPLGDGFSQIQAVSPDDRYAVLGLSRLEIWDMQTRNLITTLDPYKEDRLFVPDAVVYSSDGKRLAAGDTTGAVNIWNLETRLLFVTYQFPRNSIQFLYFSPDGRKLLIGTKDGAILQDVSQTMR